MATAKKLPSGSWRVQVYAGKNAEGRPQYRSFTRPTKKEAEYEALQWQMHYKEVSRDASSMTLGEAMEKYIESKDGILSPTTIRGYDVIRRHTLPELMPVKLNKLTPQMVQQAMNQAAKPYTDQKGKVKQRTPKTLRNIHGLLTAVLAEYCPGLKLNTTLPQKERKEQTILEPEQIGILLRAVEGTVMEIPVLLAVWMCMRSSEIAGLTWDCVDFERGTITIKKALVCGRDNQWVEKGTKTTSSTRTVRAPDYIMARLRAAKEEASDDHVTHLKGSCLRDRLHTITKHNGLPSIRFHDLRHTSASVMLLLNIPNKYAQARGGWATDHTMKEVYQHLMDSKRSAVDNMIDDYFYQLLEQNAGEAPPSV